MGLLLTYHSTDSVASITICREERGNALAPEDFLQLRDLLRVADNDPQVRVIILTGAGNRAFCTGADLSKNVGFFETVVASPSTGLGDVLRAARALSKPLVGRINGHCYGGGVGLLAACDVAIACHDAVFALPEIKLGLFPFVVLAGLAGRVLPGRLADLALTGEPIDAARAADIGLISRWVARADLDTTVTELTSALTLSPKLAVARGRGALQADADDFEKALQRAEAQTRLLAAERDIRPS